MYSHQSSNSNTHPTEQRHVERVMACQSTSIEPQLRLSINSDSSAPEMTDGNDSDTSIEEEFIHDAAAEELWDKWFYPATSSPHSRLFYQTQKAIRSSAQIHDGSFSPYKRNYRSANLSDSSLSTGPKLEQSPSDIIYNSQRGRSQSNLILPSHQDSYSAFPPSPPPVPPEPKNYRPNTPPHFPHKSWPNRSSSRQQPQRPPFSRLRANTTPAQHSPTNQPSNLSYCTTRSPDLPSTPNTEPTSPLYMRSVPNSPCGPLPQLMHLMEKSVFEDDDEDEESAHLGIIRSLENKLHIRSGSGSRNGSKQEKEEVEGRKGGSLRIKKTVERLRGVFGMRKSVR